MKKIKTIFIGSGHFAVPIIKKIIESDLFDLTAVVTQPDKPVGRKQLLTPPPVKANIDKGITLYQPIKLRKESKMILDKEKPELVIVADYGQMIPKDILDYPKYKCLNIHGSLLPDLRGAAPIPIAILRGYKKTGVSIPVMTPGLDDGPVVTEAEVKISRDDTNDSLTDKLSVVGADLLEKTIKNWVDGKIEAKEQDHSKATIITKDDISKEKAFFTKETNIEKVEHMIRAFYPWPIAWTYINWNGKQLRLKVYRACLSSESIESGKLEKKGNSIFLGLDDGALLINELQLEGKKRGGIDEYIFLEQIPAQMTST